MNSAACTVRFVLCGTLLGILSGSGWAQFDPLPGPLSVPGKTISDWTISGDQDSAGLPNSHLTRNWLGDGTTTDSLDYSTSLSAFASGGALPDVDALAHFADLFFADVINDFSTLLVSPRELQHDFVNGGLNEIYYQTSSLFGSTTGVWAKNAPEIGGAPTAPDNTPPEGIDGLELWGTSSDHNMFSLYNDPFDTDDPQQRGVSVFQYDPLSDVSSPYIYNDEIRSAMGLLPTDPAIDLDGMMVHDDLGDGIFNLGDSILLTLAENGMFHGGEIWVWKFGSSATFLTHGGVTWDSANQPGLLFGWVGQGGAAMNDINGLESIMIRNVPEPGHFMPLATGLFAAFSFPSRRRRVC